MNIKDRINFKTLREKGPKSINVTDDEVVQLHARGCSTKYILDQEYYFSLLTKETMLKTMRGEPVKTTPHNPKQIMEEFNKLKNITSNILNADDSLQFYGCATNNLSPDKKEKPNLNFQIKEKDILFFYDRPLIFTATNSSNNTIYLCNLARAIKPNIEEFLLIDINQSDSFNKLYKKFLNNDIDFLTLINSSNTYYIYSIVYSENKLPQTKVQEVNKFFLQQNPHFLPEKDFFLKPKSINNDCKLIEELISSNRIEQKYKDALSRIIKYIDKED